ncbi:MULTISPECIES: NIPSNAP family protein [Acetobacteraceae]|uniref:NIPSNAP family protein n=1 Tax=Acetobacteraceae TaxID=433 RepID=UPI0039E7B9C6
MIYEMIRFRTDVLGVPALSRLLKARFSDTLNPVAGSLTGVWRTEIGELGTLLLLRSFSCQDALLKARHRTLESRTPFGIKMNDVLIEAEAFEGFPFLKPPEFGECGGLYEIRTYSLKAGGLEPTLKAWQSALKPAQAYTRHLITNMFALDGASRICHIWAFDSFEQRNILRQQHYADGLWPPKGGPEQIIHAQPCLCLPETFSPLR